MSTNTAVRTRTRSRVNQGTMVKSVERKSGSETVSKSESVERFVAIDEVSPAYVSIGGSVTKNLGDYNSVKITAQVTLPCAPTAEACRITKDLASKMVDEYVGEELDQLDS